MMFLVELTYIAVSLFLIFYTKWSYFEFVNILVGFNFQEGVVGLRMLPVSPFINCIINICYLVVNLNVSCFVSSSIACFCLLSCDECSVFNL